MDARKELKSVVGEMHGPRLEEIPNYNMQKAQTNEGIFHNTRHQNDANPKLKIRKITCKASMVSRCLYRRYNMDHLQEVWLTTQPTK